MEIYKVVEFDRNTGISTEHGYFKSEQLARNLVPQGFPQVNEITPQENVRFWEQGTVSFRVEKHLL